MEYLLLCWVSAVIAAVIARWKGSSMVIWFIVGGVIPVLGPLGAALYRREDDEPLRACPRCGNVVPIHDALCTNCGTELDFPEPDELVAPGARA